MISAIVDPELRDCIGGCCGLLIDFFDAFIAPLEEELGQRSANVIGKLHGMGNQNMYKSRIDAINCSMANDDGINTRNYPEAEIEVRRVWKAQTLLAWIILPVSYFFADPEKKINWVYGIGGQQTWVSQPLCFGIGVLLLPLLIYVPTHYILKRYF